MKTGKYSLFQLLNNPEIEQIIIPEIQRDYVWGKDNVSGLLNSIFQKYQHKQTIQLHIQIEGNNVSDSIENYLSKEYDKLVHCTKIGFLYAYHDPNYPGKFFLIDGQQRITTLFLLLLALYKRQPSKKQEFLDIYFPCQLPKIDYRVRELTHDFLISFINHELSSSKITFKDSPNYYEVLYGSDQTTKTIVANYSFIESFISDKLVDNLEDFTEYIEHFIDFNFFDTNISAQGERLYLYMNSRGENLSYQETIKSIIISRCNSEDKNHDGLIWEEWQDFFWNNRAQNINADFGMQKFLKWAVIIQICTNDKTILKEPKLLNNKPQTKEEIIEDYVRSEISKEKDANQLHTYIRNYIKDNPKYNIEWLSKIMLAIIKLYQFIETDNSIYDFIKQGWLWESETTTDYISLLPILSYIIKFPEACIDDVKGLGYFLRNKVYNETHKKNPDRATILAINMVNSMLTNDIADLSLSSFVTDTDVELFNRYKDSQNRKNWELAFAEYVNKKDIGDFIDGKYYCLLFLSKTPRDFQKYLSSLENLYKQKDDISVRKQLLKYGDFKIDDGGGSNNLGEWMRRYNWISCDNDWKHCLGISPSDKAFEESFVYTHLKNYLDQAEATVKTSEQWYRDFLDDDFILFRGLKKFLYKNDSKSPYIILLESVQASEEKSRILEIEMLNQLIGEQYTHWVYNFRTLVIAFEINNGKCQIINEESIPFEERSNYFMDVCFNWQPEGKSEWCIKIGQRNNTFANFDIEGYELTDNRYIKKLSTNPSNKTIKENVIEIKNKIIALIEENEVVGLISKIK